MIIQQKSVDHEWDIKVIKMSAGTVIVLGQKDNYISLDKENVPELIKVLEELVS